MPFGILRKRGYVARAGEIRDPPDQWAIAYDLQEIARSHGQYRELSDFARMVVLCHLIGFLGICRDSSKTGPIGRGGRNMRPPDPRPIA